MNSECRHAQSLFDRMLDGDLPDGELSRVRAHLSACPSCRGALRSEQEVIAAIEGLPEIPCPEEVLTRVRRSTVALDSQLVCPHPWSSWLRRRRWLALPVGLAAAAIVILLFVRRSVDLRDTRETPVSVEEALRARALARWSLALAAEKMGTAEREAARSVLANGLPSTLRRSILDVAQPEIGGRHESS